MSISTHVLDTRLGKPAKEVPVMLQLYQGNGEWQDVSFNSTNDDGRVPNLVPEDATLELGSNGKLVLRVTFDTGAYFKAQDIEGFYPYVPVIFEINSTSEHYHIPLLLSPFGYSTYRGS